MASTPRPNRRLRLAVVGAAARGASRSDAGPKAPIGPRSQIPVFVIKKGRYTGFDAPGPVGNDNLVKINNRGQIAGATSTGPPQRTHGFLLRDGGGGPFTPIDVPGAPGTGATGINDAGTIVGNYTNPMARPARNQPKPPMGRTA
jgi:hypothetical protein